MIRVNGFIALLQEAKIRNSAQYFEIFARCDGHHFPDLACFKKALLFLNHTILQPAISEPGLFVLEIQQKQGSLAASKAEVLKPNTIRIARRAH